MILIPATATVLWPQTFQGLMYFQLQIECHPHSEGNQTSLSSLSKTLLWQYWIPQRESLRVLLVISGPLGFQLKPSSPAFSKASPLLQSRGRNQAPGCASTEVTLCIPGHSLLGPEATRAGGTGKPQTQKLHRSQSQEERGAGGQRGRCVNGGKQPAPAWAWGRLTLPGMVRVTSSPGGWGVQGWHAASSGQEPACSSATRQMGTELEREGE